MQCMLCVISLISPPDQAIRYYPRLKEKSEQAILPLKASLHVASEP